MKQAKKEIILSGFKNYDDYSGGFSRGDLVLLASKPAVGKTSLAMDIARNTAINSGGKVAIFSLEMLKEELAVKYFSSLGKVGTKHIVKGSMGVEDWKDVFGADKLLQQSNIYIDDLFNITPSKIFSECQGIKNGEGLDLIVIDYLQMLNGEKGNCGKDYSNIMKELKDIAKTLDVAIIITAQLPNFTKSGNETPTLEDVKNYLPAVEYADDVLLLHRLNCNENISHLLVVAKHHKQKPTEMLIDWNCSFATFENIVFLDRIKVEGLFNLYDYDIDFNNSANVSILIAPNGFGKTTIFNYINFFCNPTKSSFLKIVRVPTRLFKCFFSNGISIVLKSSEDKTQDRVAKKLGFNKSIVLYDSQGKEIFKFDLLHIYQSCSKGISFEKSLSNLLNNYKRAIKSFLPNLNYITADRVLFNAVKLVEQGISTNSKLPSFGENINDLSVNDELFFDDGLMERASANILYQHKRELNCKAYTKEELLKRADYFKKIYNERNYITKKTIVFCEINNRLAFKIYQNGRELGSQSISSGEVNDFSLFFQLIFNTSKSSIILIDEPEISLHISWQETLLDYFKEISKLNNCQIIVATHSPNVINGHIELLASKEVKDVTD